MHPRSISYGIASGILPQAPSQAPVRPSLGKEAVNTHFFDGKLGGFISSVDPAVSRNITAEIERASTADEKALLFDKLRERVREYSGRSRIPDNSVRHLDEIISEYKRSGRTRNGNYDMSNNLYACDLLFLLTEKVLGDNGDEYMRLLLEQLDEMSTGNCPAGRCTRLFQALVMLRDDLTPTSKLR